MRRILGGILIIIAFSSMTKGQVVEITDSNFRNCLANTLPHLLDADQNLIIDSAKSFNGSLICAGQGIESVPELVYFESLFNLELNQNELTELPSLDNLKELRILYVAENKLTELPSLDSLLELTKLICWRNQLTTLPDLTHLDKLYRLDVPVNNLTVFPELSLVAPMRTILVDDNFIQDLPDLSIYSNLEIVKLVNNLMSFGDLSMIFEQSNPSIYDYYPQKFFPVLNAKRVNEGERLILTASLDNISIETSTEWLKDNTLLKAGDTFDIDNVMLSDSGVYRAVINSPLFPNKPLYTNAAVIQVLPCPKLEDFEVQLENTTCTSPGEITIATSTSTNYEYVLGAQDFSKTIIDRKTFDNLLPNTYSLEIVDPKGCIFTFSTDLTIEPKECDDVLISPNGDGYQDEYYFDYTGKGVIFDKFGNVVLEMDFPYTWDGNDRNQTKLAQGYYTLSINDGESLIGITILY